MNRSLRITLALVLAALALVAVVWLPVADGLLVLVAWIDGAGAAGVAAFAGVYVVGTVLMAPGSMLTMGAGFAWGPLWGVAVVSPASVAGATLAFLLGRTLLRDWVRAKVSGRPRFAALDRAVGENGFKIVFLLRLSPVFPFNLLNYALGLTRVPLATYAAASFLGMLPGTFLYVYIGSLVTNLAQLAGGERPDAGIGQQLLLFGGLVATLILVIVIARIARRALREAMEAA